MFFTFWLGTEMFFTFFLSLFVDSTKEIHFLRQQNFIFLHSGTSTLGLRHQNTSITENA